MLRRGGEEGKRTNERTIDELKTAKFRFFLVVLIRLLFNINILSSEKSHLSPPTINLTLVFTLLHPTSQYSTKPILFNLQ